MTLSATGTLLKRFSGGKTRKGRLYKPRVQSAFFTPAPRHSPAPPQVPVPYLVREKSGLRAGSILRFRAKGYAMAKVWFVHKGPEPTVGAEAYVLPGREAIESLGVARSSIMPQRPKFNPTSPLGRISGYRRVVLEIQATDAISTGWAEGYYLVPGGPQVVIVILGPPNNPFFQ